MKALLLLPLLMASCAFGPGVYYGKTGSIYAHTGGAFLAARKEVIAEVETKGGDKIKYMAKGEEADDVALAAAAAYGMVGMAKEATATEAAKQSTAKAGIKSNETIELGKQSVEKLGIESASEVPKFIPR